MIVCRLVESPRHGVKPQPGDVWAEPLITEGPYLQWYLDQVLSEQYRRDHLGRRPPLFVCLPNGRWWSPDSRMEGAGSRGWTVTGEAPLLTCSPSIVLGGWHGHLTAGRLR